MKSQKCRLENNLTDYQNYKFVVINSALRTFHNIDFYFLKLFFVVNDSLYASLTFIFHLADGFIAVIYPRTGAKRSI